MMAWNQNMNRGWAKGPALPVPAVNTSRFAGDPSKKDGGSTQTPPYNPADPTAKPTIVAQPPVVTGQPTPTTDIPLPSAPTHPYGANYVPRTNVPGYAAGGNSPGFVFNGRRAPSALPPPATPPPGGGQDPNKPAPPPGGGAPSNGPVFGGGDSGRNGGATDPGAPPVARPVPGQPPPVAPPPAAPPPGAPRPPRPQRPGQVSQQAAQALYSAEFGTIPHEFKGQLMELARGGNAQAFNEALFNSNIPHEMKMRLQQLFGFGAAAPAPNAPSPQPQGTPQPPPVNPGATVPQNQPGSPYYGAF